MQLAERISGLAILDNVGDVGPVTDADVGLHMARATALPRYAANQWIDLAVQRIRRELGEDVPGAMEPVRLCLRAALTSLALRRSSTGDVRVA